MNDNRLIEPVQEKLGQREFWAEKKRFICSLRELRLATRWMRVMKINCTR